MPRYKFCYSKQGPARYMSHLDLVRTLGRALRRADLPVAYSEGFNPQPRLGFAAPLPVGTAGLAEWGELIVTQVLAEEELLMRLNAVLPRGLRVLQVWPLPQDAPALMATVESAVYEVQVIADGLLQTELTAALDLFLAQEQITITRRNKKGQLKTRDIKPGINQIKLLSATPCHNPRYQNGLQLKLAMELKTGSVINVRPEEVIEAFLSHTGLNLAEMWQITRISIKTQ